MPSRQRYRRNYGHRQSSGYEQARAHIEEARKLSAELGGTDKDVKRYFFSLSTAELTTVLKEYEQRYGIEARQYAEATIPRWRNGSVKMSGQNASRLFNLLPPRMPAAEKYRLTETLWKHTGPSSQTRLRIGLNAGLEDIISALSVHIEQVIVQYKVPADLERRFEWLSAGDVVVKQDLLNHLRSLEKGLVIQAARTQVPFMIEHLKNDEEKLTHRFAQVLIIGKHQIELLVDKTANGVQLEEWVPPSTYAISTTPSSGNWIWWIAGLALLVLWLSYG